MFSDGARSARTLAIILIVHLAVIVLWQMLVDAFQVPKFIKIVDEMPMTATGKLRKVELRQAFADHFSKERA